MERPRVRRSRPVPRASRRARRLPRGRASCRGRRARPRVRRRSAWRAAPRARTSLPGCRCRAGDGRRRSTASRRACAGRGRRPQHLRARGNRRGDHAVPRPVLRDRPAAPSSPGRASFTSGKLVFDLNPRQFALEAIVADLRAAGFEQVVMRPFFVPQTVKLPRASRWRAPDAGTAAHWPDCCCDCGSAISSPPA